MSKEWSPESLFEVLASETARTILARAAEQPISAERAQERCDASLTTVYRRLDALQRWNLLAEQSRIDSDGNHYTVYQTTVDRIVLEPDEDDLATEVYRDRDLVDRFDDLWSDLGDQGNSRAQTE